MESPLDEPAVRIFEGRKFYLGLIHDEGENTPEEIEELNKIYASIDRETLPETYDSRAKGNYIDIWCAIYVPSITIFVFFNF